MRRETAARRPGMMPLLAVTVFASASTVHFQTPMLGRFAGEFEATPAAIGWIPTLTFAGFLAGIVLLVPFGDRIDKRRLIALGAAMFAIVVQITHPARVLPCQQTRGDLS